jgi:GNAT superfamily N-acetyltransferase
MSGSFGAVPAHMDLSPMHIREMSVSDAEAIAELAAQLGYPVSAEIMKRRIGELQALGDHIVYVACSASDTLVGWLHVGIVHHLQADVCAEIGGLVVAASVRSHGIGRLLVARAEEWARHRGVNRILVRSNIIRDAAHRFYLREGYSRKKMSAVFEKILA